MASAGQMPAQTPQPAQMTSSICAFPFSRSQRSPGHRKIRVHRRLQPQASPLQRSSSTRMMYRFLPFFSGDRAQDCLRIRTFRPPPPSMRLLSVSRVSLRAKGSPTTTGAPIALQRASISTIGEAFPMAFISIPGWDWNPVIAVPLLSRTMKMTFAS